MCNFDLVSIYGLSVKIYLTNTRRHRLGALDLLRQSVIVIERVFDL